MSSHVKCISEVSLLLRFRSAWGLCSQVVFLLEVSVLVRLGHSLNLCCVFFFLFLMVRYCVDKLAVHQVSHYFSC